MSLLINPGDRINVKFFVAEVNALQLVTVAETSQGALDLLPAGTTQDKLEEHTFSFKYPSFKDTTLIFDASLRANDDGLYQLQMSTMRYNRLKYLLQSWTLKDDKGVVIPISEETVSQLHPNVGSYVASRLEELIKPL